MVIHLDPHAHAVANSVCIKEGGEIQEDIADLETDTVSSTSSDPPPPDKIATTRVSNEAEISTQFVQEGDERNSPDTCSKTPDCVSEKGKITTNSMEMGKKDESFISPDCGDDDEVDVEMVDSPEEKAEVSSTATQTVTGQSFLQEDSNPEEKAGEKVDETNTNDDCEMSANENDEPRPKSVERTKPSNSAHSADAKKMSNRKKRYRCKHCDERFSFPVQVHMHMQKVHASLLSQKERKPDRRSSVNTPTTHNNNNETSSKNNVQMYPLRSLHARAKRRTRSMQSSGDGSGNSSRRNSQTNNNNNEEKKERKSIHKKIIYFTCRHCSKKFPLLNQLKIHLHKVHPEMTKKFQNLNQTLNKSVGKRTFFTPQSQSQRLLISSKRRQTTTSVMLQNRDRPLRASTRSVSRADSEPESGRMSTRRRSSVACKSEKSCGDSSNPTTVSSRRSSRRRDDEVKVENAKVDSESEMEVEQGIGESVPQGKSVRGKTRSTSSNNNNSNKYLSDEGKPVVSDESDAEEEKPEVKPVKIEGKGEIMQMDADKDVGEEDSIYNDSDCMVVDTFETIMYALTSKTSQTCPNCNKYCKFAGNFRLHLKACMGLNDDLERTDEGEGSSQRKSEKMNEDLEEEEEEQEEDEEEEGEEVDEEEKGVESEEEKQENKVIEKINSENQEEEEQVNEGVDVEEDDDDDSKVPYYDRLDYRTCWVCGFVVSRFHNLSRHLKQRHEISMGTKEVHAKMAKILRLKK